MNPNSKNPRQNVTKPEGQENPDGNKSGGQGNKPQHEHRNRNQNRGGQPQKQNNQGGGNQEQGGQPQKNEQENPQQGQGNRNQANKSGNQNSNKPKQQGQANRQQGNNQGNRQNNQGNSKQQGNKQQGGQQKQQSQKAAPLVNARTIVELSSKTPRKDIVLPPMLKVCGNRDTANIQGVVATEPDFLGFIFATTSPRYVGDDFEMPKDLPEFIKTVGVFVNTPVEEIIEKFDRYYLAYVQLHGDEPISVCEALSEAGIPVIKVFSVGPDFDFRTTKAFENSVDYFLFDTKGEKAGGNGIAFDWSLLKRYVGKTPFFLSGGLTPENISRAMDLRLKGLAGFDINSGVELSPGIKDAELILKVKDQIRLKHNPV